MHDLIVGTEMIHTDDGEPQPRQSMFVECADMNCECGGKFFLRDNEIDDFISKACDAQKSRASHLKELQDIQKLLERTEGYSHSGSWHWIEQSIARLSALIEQMKEK